MGADSGRFRGTESRISQWLRRRPKSPGADTDESARV
ncbi:DNA primase, partial [Streptomyces griseus]|nr:DNA primase [Streptomyces griseus]